MNELQRMNLTNTMRSREEAGHEESIYCHYIYKVQKQTKFILHINIAGKAIKD